MIKMNIINDKNSNLKKKMSMISLIILILFILTPVFQSVREFISPARESDIFGIDFTYESTVNLINFAALGFGLLLWFLFVHYNQETKISFKELCRMYLPQWIFLCFIVWMITDSLIIGKMEYAFEALPYRNESLLTYSLYFGIYFFAGMMLSDEKHRVIVAYFQISVSMIIAFIALIQSFLMHVSFFRSDGKGLSAVFYNSNHYSYYLTVSVLAAAVMFTLEKRKSLRILAGVSFILNLTAMMISNTAGCILAVFCGLGLWIVLRLKTDRKERMIAFLELFAAILLLVCVKCFFNYDKANFELEYIPDVENEQSLFIEDEISKKDVSETLEPNKDTISDENAEKDAAAEESFDQFMDRISNYRWVQWKHTVGYISEKPLTGFGLEGIGDRLEKLTGGESTRPHNEYLQYTANWGIPALFLYLAGIIIVAWRLLKNRRKLSPVVLAAGIASFGYLVSAFFGNTKYYTAPFLFIFLGIAAGGVSCFCWKSDDK